MSNIIKYLIFFICTILHHVAHTIGKTYVQLKIHVGTYILLRHWTRAIPLRTLSVGPHETWQCNTYSMLDTYVYLCIYVYLSSSMLVSNAISQWWSMGVYNMRDMLSEVIQVLCCLLSWVIPSSYTFRCDVVTEFLSDVGCNSTIRSSDYFSNTRQQVTVNKTCAVSVVTRSFWAILHGVRYNHNIVQNRFNVSLL